ncbi:MAG: 1-acyl-sn-glycerol-3-phosphate acyltransferase [Longimicrobiales bacterium]|nr:1-acyl-sn-glycerol-3-phosphate acyltransferase [Longimicrobiales bacterium]
MKVRGTVTLGVAAVALILTDLVQRVGVVLLLRLLPSRRHRILARWQQFMADLMIVIVRRVGGARIPDPPRIPGGEGVLVLMNHQSLLDIPLVVKALRPTYPRIVTRSRYANGKPLISHMIRLYQYPTVDPTATSRGLLERLGATAAASPVPVAIYPEGGRTRTGAIGTFKRNGLRAILGARQWEVWMLTADGYWQCARAQDFRSGVSGVRGAARVDGPFPAPPPGAPLAEVDAFIDRMRARMQASLAALRAPVPPAP